MNGEQVTELKAEIDIIRRDVRGLRRQVRAHQRQHDEEREDRRRLRWRVAGLLIAAVAAIDGPLVTLFLARH